MGEHDAKGHEGGEDANQKRLDEWEGHWLSDDEGMDPESVELEDQRSLLRPPDEARGAIDPDER